MKLTQAAITRLKPSDKATASRPDRHTDGQGLQLLVRPTGTKSWVSAYRWQGKQQAVTLGKWPTLSLTDARAKNLAIKQMLANGVNPRDQLKAEQLQQTGGHLFDSIAKKYHKQQAKRVKPATHAAALSLYNRYILPALGNKAINEITPPEVLNMARKIEATGSTEQARRAVRQVRQVFTLATLEGLTTSNPASEITSALTPARTTHRARVTAAELPQLLRDIKDYNGHELVKLGLLTLAYTFVRVSELVTMEWHEVDLDRALWTVPAHKMKMGRPHIVPLSPQVVAILKQIKAMGLNSSYVFYNTGTGSHYSRNALNNALHNMGYKGRMTAHGFRGLASTVLHEQGLDHDVIELQLAHVKEDKVSRAYNGAQYLAQRLQLMNKWGQYIDDMAKGGLDNVITFTPAQSAKAAVL